MRNGVHQVHHERCNERAFVRESPWTFSKDLPPWFCWNLRVAQTKIKQSNHETSAAEQSASIRCAHTHTHKFANKTFILPRVHCDSLQISIHSFCRIKFLWRRASMWRNVTITVQLILISLPNAKVSIQLLAFRWNAWVPEPARRLTYGRPDVNGERTTIIACEPCSHGNMHSVDLEM